MLVVILAVMLPRSDGTLGPKVLIGWPNRLFLVANSGWLMVAVWRAAQLNKQRS